MVSKDFYPRPPRGGRRGCFFSWRRCPTISIHALREEGDVGTKEPCPDISISIHALREEGDVQRQHVHQELRDFYPRPPRGGRPRLEQYAGSDPGFLSTPSARRATYVAGYVTKKLYDFYPRPPRGGRLADVVKQRVDFLISIHALREEGDAAMSYNSAEAAKFLSTPSARRATF